MTNHQHRVFELPAVAEATGPFCTKDFLDVVSTYDDGEEVMASAADAYLPLRRVGDTILFRGDTEVTDYHTPRGEGSEELLSDLADQVTATRFLLDSLPEEAAKPLVSGLTHAGWEPRTRVHEVAAVLHLPESIDEYMTSIGKKERHEVRRKRRRYEGALGEVRHEIHTGTGWAFDEFLRLHAMAEGEKGYFMTPERRSFFADLADLDGWRFDLLRADDDIASAIVFGYVDDSGYYLYNSGYDSAFSDSSPGVVLLGVMIEQAIAESRPRFDFLKGDETYKFRLGATARPLTEISAVRGPA